MLSKKQRLDLELRANEEGEQRFDRIPAGGTLFSLGATRRQGKGTALARKSNGVLRQIKNLSSALSFEYERGTVPKVNHATSR